MTAGRRPYEAVSSTAICLSLLRPLSPRLPGCDSQADAHSPCLVWGQDSLFAWTHLILTLHCLRICIYRVADCIVIVVGFQPSRRGLRSYYLGPLC